MARQDLPNSTPSQWAQVDAEPEVRGTCFLRQHVVDMKLSTLRPDHATEPLGHSDFVTLRPEPASHQRRNRVPRLGRRALNGWSAGFSKTRRFQLARSRTRMSRKVISSGVRQPDEAGREVE